MNETPKTVTVVPFDEVARMIENNWDVVLFSEARQAAVMTKEGAWKLDTTTKLPEVLEPKKGEDGAGKPEDIDQIPVEPEPLPEPPVEPKPFKGISKNP